jgi:uncharacterized protein
MKPRDSSDADVAALEALCERLGGFDARISLEWLDGCMAALLAGPVRRPLEHWLPRLLDDTWERTFADPADAQQALHTLGRRWDVLASQLDAEALMDEPDQLRLSPLMAQYGDAMRDQLLAEGKLTPEDAEQWPLTGELWAAAFLDTVDAFPDVWKQPDPDPGSEDDVWFNGCMAAVTALTVRDATALQAELQLRYPGQDLSREELVDEACMAVQDLRCYWVDHAPRPATRRVEAAPGRNDPCPCGSGRKYKKCHGAA